MTPEWIAVDWGTSNLRAWAMQGQAVLAETCSHDGMGKLAQAEFEPALLRLIAPWLGGQDCVPVIACGMVGSRQGWQEAPYRSVPCAALHAGALVRVQTKDPRIRMMIAPGLKQHSPADVMRGEETQIAGALTLLPEFDGVICLPGTHSKWVHVSAGEVVSFRTFMTGELFALLASQSVLRHCTAGTGWDDAAFAQGVDQALSRPESIAAQLFTLRAESLIANLSADAARARLSGLLIGAEIAAAKPYWLGQRVVLVGADTLSAAYLRALGLQGLSCERLDATACTLSGLGMSRGDIRKAAK